MNVKIIVDSTADLTAEAQKRVTVVPLTIRFGEEEYIDGITIDSHKFYEMLIESDVLPTTSQANPAVFEEVFAEAVKDGSHVVCVTCASKLSGTYQSAVIAAADYPGRVFVVDSLSATIGERILLMRGLELAQQGLDAEQIAGILDEEKSRIRVMAMIDTLEYLKKGGRISAATALAGTVLSIKPAIEVRDGEVAMAGKARGTRQGNVLLRELIGKYGGVNYNKPYALVYSGLNDDLLRKFIAEYPDLWQGRTELPIHSLGCAIGTHVGPGAYGIAFFEE